MWNNNKIKYLVIFVIIISGCNRITREDLIKARMDKNPQPFITFEQYIYTLENKFDYFSKVCDIRENSGLDYGFFDPNDIKEDSMFFLYKDNIHFVYQTYFNSVAFKTENITINSLKFQDRFEYNKKLNEEQRDSIEKIFNLQIPIESL